MKLKIYNLYKAGVSCFPFNPEFSQLSDYLVYRNDINYCINQEHVNNILIYNR